jgi:hypothetical protein
MARKPRNASIRSIYGSRGSGGSEREHQEHHEPRQALELYRQLNGASLKDLHGQLYSIERLVLKLLLGIRHAACSLLLRHRIEQSKDPLVIHPD